MVICDMHMPEMGGIDTMKMYRFAQPNRRTPFLVVTANATTETRRQCEEAGAEGFLTKPIQAQALYDALDKVVGTRQKNPPAELPGNKNRGSPDTVSLTKLAELKALSPDRKFVHELVGVFMDDATALLQKLETADERGDLQEMKNLAHSFKGSAASIGAQGLCEISAQLNQLSINKPAGDSGDLLRSLHKELERVEKELMEFLDERDTGVSH